MSKPNKAAKCALVEWKKNPCLFFLLFEVSSEFSLREGGRDKKHVKKLLMLCSYLGDKW